ncbi:hypothetical protein ACJMK2_015207 [Sinanodonta woodiana]|uniref:DZIP3-like HEPN domain-containing protein n=1 Tax=Sinanodonta woodiana TaxID=1069815 RepID=A0ABD3V2Y0_SINWO
MDIMFPPNGSATNLDDYDITLLSAIFQNFVPTLSQQEKDMIKRLREVRNKLYAHANSCQISASDFQTYWNDISSTLTTLSKQCKDTAFETKISQEIKCTQVSAIPAGAYLDILKTWFESVKDEVDSVKDEVVYVKDKVDSVKDEVVYVKDKVDSVKDEVDSVKDEVVYVKDKVDSVTDELQIVTARLHTLESKNKSSASES